MMEFLRKKIVTATAATLLIASHCMAAWTNDPLQTRITLVRKPHIDELRTQINSKRATAGLAACSWTDPVITVDVTKIRKPHLDELRSCIAAVYTAAAQPPPTWTDPVIVARTTKIRAVHWNELRAATTGAPAGCTYTLSSNSQSAPSGGGSYSVNVTAGAGCAWAASSDQGWASITGGSSGTGNGTVSYTVASNGGGARSATLTIGGQSLTVSQAAAPSCTYLISPTSQSVTSAGGSYSVSVTAGAGCAWTASSNQGWASITAGSSGSGNGTVSYSVSSNSGGARNATLTIAGNALAVSQSAAATGSTATFETGSDGWSFSVEDPSAYAGRNIAAAHTGSYSAELSPGAEYCWDDEGESVCEYYGGTIYKTLTTTGGTVGVWHKGAGSFLVLDSWASYVGLAESASWNYYEMVLPAGTHTLSLIKHGAYNSPAFFDDITHP